MVIDRRNAAGGKPYVTDRYPWTYILIDEKIVTQCVCFPMPNQLIDGKHLSNLNSFPVKIIKKRLKIWKIQKEELGFTSWI